MSALDGLCHVADAAVRFARELVDSEHANLYILDDLVCVRPHALAGWHTLLARPWAPKREAEYGGEAGGRQWPPQCCPSREMATVGSETLPSYGNPTSPPSHPSCHTAKRAGAMCTHTPNLPRRTMPACHVSQEGLQLTNVINHELVSTEVASEELAGVVAATGEQARRPHALRAMPFFAVG